MEWLTQLDRQKATCLALMPIITAVLYSNVTPDTPAIVHIIYLAIMYTLYIKSTLHEILTDVGRIDNQKETAFQQNVSEVVAAVGEKDLKHREYVAVHGVDLKVEYIPVNDTITSALRDGGLVVSLRQPRVWKNYITEIELFLRTYYSSLKEGTSRDVGLLLTSHAKIVDMGHQMLVALPAKYIDEVKEMTFAIEMALYEKCVLHANSYGRTHHLPKFTPNLAICKTATTVALGVAAMVSDPQVKR